MDPAPRRGLPRWGLSAITLAAPFVVLLALEGGLRLVGLGGIEPLFVPAEPAPGYRQANPRVATRLVVDPSQPPLATIDTSYFAERRPPHGLRLVVQGGSTAAGFPYGRWASLAGMLHARLRAAFPEREIETISTAMSAVNSWALLDFAEEIVAVEPDAVLIYAGHNEYLGLLGVGSTFSAGRSRATTLAFLALRDVRIFRMLQWGYAGARRLLFAGGAPPAREDVNLMERVAAETEIPYGSALYRRGIEQLRANLGSVLARYRRRGIRVFLGTLASNERDQPPFASRLAPGVDAASWQRSYDDAAAALERGDTRGAARALAECLRLDDGAADAHFLHGRLLEARGESAGARRAYRSAVDRDQLRFRAPQAMNEALRELAHAHGAVLVESQQALADASPGGIVGAELMLEHLHPNVEGYFLLAEAFHDALRASGLLGRGGRDVPVSVARARQPVTEIDRLAGEHRVAVLRAGWPFQPRGAEKAVVVAEPGDLPGRLALQMARAELSWTEAMRKGLADYVERGDHEEAARIAVNLAEVYPLAAAPKAEAGRLLMVLGRRREALAWLERAVALAPDRDDYASALELARRATRASPRGLSGPRPRR